MGGDLVTGAPGATLASQPPRISLVLPARSPANLTASRCACWQVLTSKGGRHRSDSLPRVLAGNGTDGRFSWPGSSGPSQSVVQDWARFARTVSPAGSGSLLPCSWHTCSSAEITGLARLRLVAVDLFLCMGFPLHEIHGFASADLMRRAASGARLRKRASTSVNPSNASDPAWRRWPTPTMVVAVPLRVTRPRSASSSARSPMLDAYGVEVGGSMGPREWRPLCLGNGDGPSAPHFQQRRPSNRVVPVRCGVAVEERSAPRAGFNWCGCSGFSFVCAGSAD